MQEIDRYVMRFTQYTVLHSLFQCGLRFPIIERSVTADVHLLTDPSFAAGIRKSAQRILSKDRGQKAEELTGSLPFDPVTVFSDFMTSKHLRQLRS